MNLYKCLTCGHVVESEFAGFDKLQCPHCSSLSRMAELTPNQVIAYRKHREALGLTHQSGNCWIDGGGHFKQ